MKKHNDDGERPTATRNGEIGFMLSQLFVDTRLRMRDTMALVSSSHGTIYRSKRVTKYVYRNDENRQFIMVKYLNDPPKWADDDRTDWTVKMTARD